MLGGAAVQNVLVLVYSHAFTDMHMDMVLICLCITNFREIILRNSGFVTLNTEEISLVNLPPLGH